MDHGGVNLLSAVLVKVHIVMPPVMRKIGTHQDDVAGIESLDMIAHELRTSALMEMDELYLGMIMPAIIDMRIPVFTDTERMCRGSGNF